MKDMVKYAFFVPANRISNLDVQRYRAAKRQDDVSRQRRLNNACCPEHGVMFSAKKNLQRNMWQIKCVDCILSKGPFAEWTDVKKASKLEQCLENFCDEDE